jgi:hypothetical protein
MPEALQKADLDRMLVDAIKTKVDRGERITHDERRLLHADVFGERMVQLLGDVRKVRESDKTPVLFSQGTANSIREAVRLLLAEIYAVSLAQDHKRQALEGRIAALKARERDGDLDRRLGRKQKRRVAG